MARAGARIIVDEVFLSGATGQRRWETSGETRPKQGAGDRVAHGRFSSY